MDKEKIIKLNIKPIEAEEKSQKQTICHNLLHTNPILQKMFFVNQAAKKNKFNFKDLFR